MNESTFIKNIQNEMRKDSGVDGDAQRLSQLVWIIFLKIIDDEEIEREALDDNYLPAVPDKYRWRTWAADPMGLTGDALLRFINDDLFPGLKDLPFNDDNRLTSVVREVFAELNNYMKDGTQLRKIINIVNTVDFNTTKDRHAFGDIYEKLLSSLQSAGNSGEFYTPRPITNFIVEMVNPQLGEKVLDPAAGTGGFLAAAVDHLNKQVQTTEQRDIIQNSIYGIEWKQLPYSLLITNMIFHGIDQPDNIRHDDALSRPLTDYGRADQVDCICANPPFGGVVAPGVEMNFPTKYRSKETADLFIALMMRRLSDGGRAGIVLPDGFLFNTDNNVKVNLKKDLLTDFNLHTIIRLPGSVFAPYTSIATNLLFFDKGKPTEGIWYYEHTLPAGVKAYNKTNPIKLSEFDPIRQWWNNRVENEHAWYVPVEQIVERNYNLDIKNPRAKVDEELDPVELLRDYRAKRQQAEQIIAELKTELQNLLNSASAANGDDK
ncbi:MAG: class I SAM-dependent DNA methyltransferase [Candidatus Saccharibacteria bacterium]|nr:class I SAM-dependent DNA methyltransferase [Candidatus Saccharibacteria bacterium]